VSSAKTGPQKRSGAGEDGARPYPKFGSRRNSENWWAWVGLSGDSVDWETGMQPAMSHADRERVSAENGAELGLREGL
jgi:hypothetical protein